MYHVKPNKLHESLAILNVLNNEIQLISELIDEADELCKKENNSKNFVRYYVLYGKIVIHAISFLDEFDILKSLQRENQNIKKLYDSMKPLNRRLRKWHDLEKYRNTYFAHNFRDSKSNNRFILFDDYITTLNAPISHFDIKLIAKIVDLMYNEINDFFKNEMIVAIFALADSRNENENLRTEKYSKSVKTLDEFNAEIKILEDELIKIKENY